MVDNSPFSSRYRLAESILGDSSQAMASSEERSSSGSCFASIGIPASSNDVALPVIQTMVSDTYIITKTVTQKVNYGTYLYWIMGPWSRVAANPIGLM